MLFGGNVELHRITLNGKKRPNKEKVEIHDNQDEHAQSASLEFQIRLKLAVWFTRTMSLKVEICSDGGRTVVKEDAQWEVVASGVFWAEGPVYVPFLDSLLFSDVVGNTMYKWNVTKGLETFRTVGNSGGALIWSYTVHVQYCQKVTLINISIILPSHITFNPD